MSEYLIKKDVDNILKEYASKAWNDDWKPTHETVRGDTFIEACLIIDDMPTADAQPVKHGRWIDCTFYDPCEKSWEQDYEYECSNCGHKIYNKPNDDNLFCGHCSARMDGDTSE